MNEQWKWSENSPSSPENWSIVAPSYYDAEPIDANNKSAGIVGDGLRTKENEDETVIVECGDYSFRNTKFSLFPSESISINIQQEETVLALAPDNKLRPTLSSYKYEDGYIVALRKYVYSPGEAWGNSIDYKWKFAISDAGVYTLTLNAVPLVNYSNIELSPIATLSPSGENIFVLPEFPVVNLSISAYGSIVDNVRGLIYNAASTLTVSYDAAPVFNYIPRGNVSKNRIVFDNIENEKFGILNTKLVGRL